MGRRGPRSLQPRGHHGGAANASSRMLAVWPWPIFSVIHRFCWGQGGTSGRAGDFCDATGQLWDEVAEAAGHWGGGRRARRLEHGESGQSRLLPPLGCDEGPTAPCADWYL